MWLQYKIIRYPQYEFKASLKFMNLNKPLDEPHLCLAYLMKHNTTRGSHGFGFHAVLGFFANIFNLITIALKT